MKGPLPGPPEEYAIEAGRARARARSSATDFTGNEGCTTTIYGCDATSAIGAKSRNVSYGKCL